MRRISRFPKSLTDNALKVAFAKLYQTVKKDIGDIRQEKIDMCDIHAVGKMVGKLSAERDTFMKEKEEYLESIQSQSTVNVVLYHCFNYTSF